ncbi:hypothetical protein M885DRAFT_519624 [Pelagophyceae sp. CCMP2097]|nr:hypothetical protein M885DRAFT_519624 [Pelagophyceae sp. CCMP2097]
MAAAADEAAVMAVAECGLEEARAILAENQGSVSQALASFFAGAVDEGEEDDESPQEDVADSIVSHAARGSVNEPTAAKDAWKHVTGGARLGAGDSGDEAASAAPVAAMPPRARGSPETELRVEVVFFADGFTVEEDVAVAAAAPAPKRAGVATLRDSAPDPKKRAPPPLRSFGSPESKIFLSHLNRSEVPPEFRRLDAEGRPVRVRFGVADARPANCPWTKRDSAQPEDPAPAEPASFGGAGHRLDGGAASDDKAESPALAVDEGPAPIVDATQPQTTLSVKLLDGKRVKVVLNLTHTVAHLRAHLCESGHANEPYTLLAGFPPKPLEDPLATVEAAKLAGAALQQQRLRRA